MSPELASSAGIVAGRRRAARLTGTFCRRLHRPGLAGRGLLTLLTGLHTLVARATRTLGGIPPPLLESANKLRVLRGFEDPFSVLGPVAREASPAELVATAYRRIPEDAVWVAEGLACRFADDRGLRSATPERRWLADLPPRARVPAHAGVGISIAWRRLGELRRDDAPCASAAHAPRRHLERFVHDAEETALEGSVETVFESLGFASRLLFPAQVPRVAPHLAAVDTRLPACFWHGFGRALYFTPAGFLPRTGSAWRAIRHADTEPPDREARDRALEGFAWPLLLVNLRTPEILAELLHHHGELAERAPFRRGLEAALGVWSRTTARPDDLVELARFEPPVRDSRTVEVWTRLVREPCERSLEADR